MKKLFSVGNSFDKLVPIEFFWNWEEYFLLLIIAKVRRISDFSFASSLFGRSLKTRDIMTLKWSKPAPASVGHNIVSVLDDWSDVWREIPSLRSRGWFSRPKLSDFSSNTRSMMRNDLVLWPAETSAGDWPFQSHDISRFERSSSYRRRGRNLRNSTYFCN